MTAQFVYFTGTVAKTKQLLTIRVKNKKMFAKTNFLKMLTGNHGCEKVWKYLFALERGKFAALHFNEGCFI